MEREKVQAELNLIQERHQSALLEVRMTADKQFMEQESSQLRSLIGNVAHDLKTPLQSIAMDMEWLRGACGKLQLRLEEQRQLSKWPLNAAAATAARGLERTDNSSNTSLAQLPQQQLPKLPVTSGANAIPTTICIDDQPPRCATDDGVKRKAVGDIDRDIGRSNDVDEEEQRDIFDDVGGRDDDKLATEISSEIDGVLDSLDSTVSFMAMAINRSIDFAKVYRVCLLLPVSIST
jgi:signal transduction histidine kinase